MKRALAFTLMVLAIMIIAVSCEEPQAQVHEHTYAEEWSHDDTFHWHASACGHDEEVSDKEEHKWNGGDEDGWIVDEDSTEKEQGKKHRECSLCGYKEEGKVPLKGHVHTFSAYDHTADKHWRTCTGCGEKFTYTHTFSYASVDETNHCLKCYCDYSKNTEAHSYSKGKQKVSGETVYNICDLCDYLNKVEKAKSNSEIATAGATETITTANYTTKPIEIVNENGEKEAKTLTVNNTNVEITVTSSAVSSTIDTSTATEEEQEKTKTTISFLPGALKVEEGAKTVSLIVESAPAAVASSAEYQKTTSGTTIITSDETALAGFEFKLEGAVASDLTADGSTPSDPVGTDVTTYIAAGLEGNNLKVKYIGDNAGKAPSIKSYDKSNGKLVFTVYHFSKYIIVSTDSALVATDNLGAMYSSFGNALSKLDSSDDNKISKITLLNDAELTGSITVNKSATLDLNGKKINITNNSKISAGTGISLSVENASGKSDLIDAAIKIGSTDTVDGAYYNTLREAIVAVSEDTRRDNDTITLLKDADLNDCMKVKEDIGINLNSKTLKVKDDAGFDITSSLTLSNGTIETEGNSSVNDYLFYLAEAGNLTFDNVTLKVALSQSSYSEVDLIDVSVTEDSDSDTLCPGLVINSSSLSVESNASYPCYLIYIYGENARGNSKNKASVSISGSTLDAKSSKSLGSTINISVPSASKISRSTIKGNNNIIVDLSDGSHTIEDSTIQSNTQTVKETDCALSVGGSYDNNIKTEANVSVDNVTLKVAGAKALDVAGFSNKQYNQGEDDSTVDNYNENKPVPTIKGTVTAYLTGESDEKDDTGKYLKLSDNAKVDLKYNNIVAKISNDGTTQGYYTSLYEAVLAAKNNETVILLCDASGSGLERKDSAETGHEARETITIDFNDHTYTMDSNSVGSSGTQTQAMHWGKSLESLTLKNGTFAVSESADNNNKKNNAKTNFNMGMQCYVPLTAENMTFDLTNVPDETYDSSYGKDENWIYFKREKPHFNCYDTTTFTNCTITLNTDNDYGLLAGDNTTTEGKVTLNSTKLTGNATFETVGKGSITLKNGSTISGDVGSQFTDSNNKIKEVTKDNVTTYTYVVETAE